MPEPPNGCSKKIKTLQWTYRDWLVIVAIFYLALVWHLYLQYNDRVHLALPSIASALVIASLIINFKWASPEKKSGEIATYVLFGAAVSLSFMIYALPNIKMSDNLLEKFGLSEDKKQSLKKCREGDLTVVEINVEKIQKNLSKISIKLQ